MKNLTVCFAALALHAGTTVAAERCCRLFVERVGARQGNSVCATSDGGYLVAGYRETTTTGLDLLLMNTRCDGTGWVRSICGVADEVGNCVVRTSDGGYVVSGYTTSYGEGKADALAAKFDSDGNHLWTRTWGGPENDEGRGIIEGSDGDLYITGYTESFNPLERRDLFLARVPASGIGNVDYTVVYDPGLPWNDCTGECPVEVAGGFVVAGNLRNQLGTAEDILLVRFASLHQISFSRRYGLALGLAHASSAVRTFDGSVAITGWLGRPVPLGTSLFLLKVDPDLGMVWGNEMGQQQPAVTTGRDVVELPEGQLVAVGEYGIQNQERALVTKWDFDGSYLGGGSFEPDARAAVYSVANVRDYLVVMTGSVWTSTNSQLLLRAKTNSCGETCLDDFGTPPWSAWDPFTVPIELQRTVQASSTIWSPPMCSPILWINTVCTLGLADMNCDSRLDFGDINPFVLYLTNKEEWQRRYPGCNPLVGDINGDCAYPSFGDINAFVQCLVGG